MEVSQHLNLVLQPGKDWYKIVIYEGELEPAEEDEDASSYFLCHRGELDEQEGKRGHH